MQGLWWAGSEQKFYVKMNPEISKNPSAEKWTKYFVLSAGYILLFSGLAKVISAFGKAEILSVANPIFGISFRSLMELVGLLELAISCVCLFTVRRNLALKLVAWIAINFAGYHFALWLSDSPQPCPCLGNLTEMLHISRLFADRLTQFILGYLLAGSCLIFFLKRKSSKARLAD
jgi:hypothetical protein